MFLPAITFALTLAYVTWRIHMKRNHHTMMTHYKHRIHVNGIRGKSSVTRLISASLREGGLKTLGKTTGTAARLVLDHTIDEVIDRKEADIAEQKRVLDKFRKDDYDAVVFECMAINPVYQTYLEDKIMTSDIGVITNVREDHMDMLGKTLPQIARSLCSTIPRNGYLVTAETNPEVIRTMYEECKKRHATLCLAYEDSVTDEEMAKFRHFEYKANVAVAIGVAELCGVDRQTALAGMHQAQPDPGAFILKTFRGSDKQMHWANLFAINDRESFVMTANTLTKKVDQNAKMVVILNNRQDRPERVSQFVDIAVNSVGADYIVTFGDYEKQVEKEVRRMADPDHPACVIHMGNESKYKDMEGVDLLVELANKIEEPEFMVLGAVNIHTKQSQSLLMALGESYAH